MRAELWHIDHHCTRQFGNISALLVPRERIVREVRYRNRVTRSDLRRELWQAPMFRGGADSQVDQGRLGEEIFVGHPQGRHTRLILSRRHRREAP